MLSIGKLGWSVCACVSVGWLGWLVGWPIIHNDWNHKWAVRCERQHTNEQNTQPNVHTYISHILLEAEWNTCTQNEHAQIGRTMIWKLLDFLCSLNILLTNFGCNLDDAIANSYKTIELFCNAYLRMLHRKFRYTDFHCLCPAAEVHSFVLFRVHKIYTRQAHRAHISYLL